MATATASIANVSAANAPALQYNIGSNTIEYYYTLAFSAATDTYATGGIPFDLTKAVPNWAGASGLGSLATVWIYTDTSSNSYGFIRGAAVNNGKLMIYEANVQKTNAQALNAGGNEFADKVTVVLSFVRR